MAFAILLVVLLPALYYVALSRRRTPPHPRSCASRESVDALVIRHLRGPRG